MDEPEHRPASLYGLRVKNMLGDIQTNYGNSDTDASLKRCSTPPLWRIDAVGRGVHVIVNVRFALIPTAFVQPQQMS
ncbi:hypothetical protein AYJ54_05400 [Bradyrhizobium centrolobii]|uniref:Uncharacterized protein n=1 Tax=Bradyrhizobium centrolobii TaxID=1505087 RepID=A0A176Z845_9BRAD|nr:hypothetical protein [Bradyrhizobium centrolobii]OAF16587.1 hypothetical protein AYJ54_05400 [Bradyrhizobium centrolobii]